MATKKRAKKLIKKRSAPTKHVSRTGTSAVARAKKFLKSHAAEVYAKALLVRDTATTKKAKRVAAKKVVAARAAYKKLS